MGEHLWLDRPSIWVGHTDCTGNRRSQRLLPTPRRCRGQSEKGNSSQDTAWENCGWKHFIFSAKQAGKKTSTLTKNSLASTPSLRYARSFSSRNLRQHTSKSPA